MHAYLHRFNDYLAKVAVNDAIPICNARSNRDASTAVSGTNLDRGLYAASQVLRTQEHAISRFDISQMITDSSDVNRLSLRGVDVFAPTARYEGLSLVFVEAQVASVPSVYSGASPQEGIVVPYLWGRLGLGELIERLGNAIRSLTRLLHERAFQRLKGSLFDLGTRVRILAAEY
jgi:hypothetical protein